YPAAQGGSGMVGTVEHLDTGLHGGQPHGIQPLVGLAHLAHLEDGEAHRAGQEQDQQCVAASDAADQGVVPHEVGHCSRWMWMSNWSMAAGDRRWSGGQACMAARGMAGASTVAGSCTTVRPPRWLMCFSPSAPSALPPERTTPTRAGPSASAAVPQRTSMQGRARLTRSSLL